MEDNRIDGKDPDRKYFIMTPQLVWALCENVYQFTLWNVIKMVAADNGECYLSTRDLAAAAMMSTGKCCQARKRLLELGLLEGKVYRDAGYQQPVWHLNIPDLWPANIDWRLKNNSLLARIEAKRIQNKG